MTSEVSESAMEARARRAARRVGLVATKSRASLHYETNRGGFQLADERTGYPEAGADFGLSAQEVIDWCAEYETQTTG